eukprot:17629-Heterococcus_DN1.PRE.2
MASEGLPREELLNLGVLPADFERLQFLWQATGLYLQTCPALSRRFSAQFKSFARVHLHGLVPKDFYASDLCSTCNSRLEPGLTCSVRVRHRTKLSPAVKHQKASAAAAEAKSSFNKAASTPSIRNEVVITCNLCAVSTKLPGTTRLGHHSRRTGQCSSTLVATCAPYSLVSTQLFVAVRLAVFLRLDPMGLMLREIIVFVKILFVFFICSLAVYAALKAAKPKSSKRQLKKMRTAATAASNSTSTSSSSTAAAASTAATAGAIAVLATAAAANAASASAASIAADETEPAPSLLDSLEAASGKKKRKRVSFPSAEADVQRQQQQQKQQQRQQKQQQQSARKQQQQQKQQSARKQPATAGKRGSAKKQRIAVPVVAQQQQQQQQQQPRKATLSSLQSFLASVQARK